MQFSEIVLSDEEFKALEAAERNFVPLTKSNQSVYYLLLDNYDFVDLIPKKQEDVPEIPANERFGSYAQLAIDTELGLSYLRYYRDQKAKELSDRRYQLKHDILVAFIGSVTTLLIEHFIEIYHFLKDVFDLWLKQ